MAQKDLPPLKYATPEDWDEKRFKNAWSAISSLCTSREDLERQLALTNLAIDKAWKELPPTIMVVPFRRCTKCDKPTQDRFGARALCAKHITGGAGVAKVLEDLFYGKD